MITFKVPLVRVYFNKMANTAKIWSIDFGPDTNEILAASVDLQGSGYTQYAPEVIDKDCPKAWICYTKVHVTLASDAHVIIRPE